MIQCLACEDWFHESCCNLRERPTSREPSPAPPENLSSQNDPNHTETGDDAASEASSSGLPPPLISGDEYESFVCGSCVSRNTTLQRWAGTSGAMLVVRDNPGSSWRRVSGPEAKKEVVQVDDNQASSSSGIKRPLSPSALDGPETKRAKGSSPIPHLAIPSCLAPPQHPLAATVMSNLNKSDPANSLGAGDIFLSLGFRGRWCHCHTCLPPLKAEPYLLDDEETYEPPDDPDSGLSLEELGMRALSRIPRDKALDGIHAFNAMRDDLVKFLRPFAQDGKVVNESDVHGFFASLKEAAAKKGRE